MLVLITALLLSGCAAPPATPAPTPAPDWKTFCSKEGGFSILLPGTPGEVIERVGLNEYVVENHVFTGAYKPIAYQVAYFDWPAKARAATPEERLAWFHNQLFKDKLQNVVGDQKIMLADHLPGHETTYKEPQSPTLLVDAMSTLRLYMVNERMYQVRVIAPISSALSPDLQHFLDSFHVNERGECETASPLQPTPTPNNVWSTFTSRDGGFSVLMPGTPGEDTQPLVLGIVTAKIHYFGKDYDPTLNYVVGYVDIPAYYMRGVDPMQLLGYMRDGLLKDKNVTQVHSEKEIWLGDHPGHEMVFEESNSQSDSGMDYIAMRLYLVHNRLYMLAVTSTEPSTTAEDTQKFLASFQTLGN
jgi:hypothetical protein